MKGMEKYEFIGEYSAGCKRETKRVIVITLLGLFLMWILFAALHFIMPDKVPLDYTVFLGGIAGRMCGSP